MTPKKLFTAWARAEVVTWTLALAGVAVSALTRWHHVLILAVVLHLIVLVGYLLTVTAVAINHRWTSRVILRALVGGVVPYASPWFLRWARRRRELDGDWRLHTNGSVPHSQRERVLAWTLRSPGQAATVGVVAAAALVSAVVWFDPPIPWTTP